jgi:hypothetical protein
MSHPQLFQLVETNASREVVMVTYQKSDEEYVQARLFTLKNDIRAQIASGEDENVFTSVSDGICFTPLTKTKSGQLIPLQPTSKSNLDYIQHTKSILSSPPKKRAHTKRSSQTGQSSIYHQPTTTHVTAVQQLGQYTAAQTNNHNTPSIRQQTEKSDDIDCRFQTIKNELRSQQTWNPEQKLWNTDITNRMGILEITTTNTDSKVDTILNKLDSWDIPMKCRGVTTNMEERNAPHPSLQDQSGAMIP